MTKENLFAVLGLDHSATAKQIKDAYRKLAKKYHPDVNPDDPHADEQFKLIAHAYWILSDKKRRKEYLAVNPEYNPPPPRKADPKPPSTEDFKSAFNAARARRAGTAAAKPGKDIVILLHLGLDDLAQGVTRKLKISRLQACEKCAGTGISGGAKGGLCPVCKGSGEVPNFANSKNGIGSTITCRKCGGSGLQPMSACGQCDGRGKNSKDVTISIGIPPGSGANDRIVVKGQGHEGVIGGDAGNLIVKINVREHPYLTRRGDDLIYNCNISLTQWLQGADIKAPTLNGQVILNLPERSAPEGALKVQGKGMPKKDGGRGDLIVRYAIAVPEELNKKQLNLLKKLESTGGFAPQPDKEGLFKRKVEGE